MNKVCLKLLPSLELSTSSQTGNREGWSTGLQLGTPCFWEEVSILIQLGVLGSILISFIQKRCRHGSRIAEEGAAKYPSGMRLGFIYKAAIVCSVLVAGIHFLMLWMILTGYEALCKSKISVLSKEILSEISWLITLLLVLNLRNSRSLKLPWILRIWWISSFILSVVHTTLYTSYIHTNHKSLSIVYYVNFIGLIVSTYLVGISIRGATGISFITNSTTESLLNKGENHSDGKREEESPYQRATLLQLITFSWLNQLFKVGYKKALEQEEIPGIDVKDSAKFLSDSFNNSLKQVKETEKTSSTSIYMAIFLLIRKKAAINAFFAAIHAGVSYVGPYLINDFVAFLSQKKNYTLKTGYIIALAFISAKMVEVTAQRQWIFGARQLGVRLKGALISQIYKKGLHLSSQSRQSHSSGGMINLMSVDIKRITDFTWYMNTIWMLPIQISLATYILYLNLGLSAYAGLAATLMVMVGTIPLQRMQKRLQSKIMEAKDERMNATSEILRNMKILKLQAWDMKYVLKLENLRKIEYIWLWKSLWLSALWGFIFLISPTFISVVTFGSCILLGIPLTAGKVLSALATFRMLQDSMFTLPDSLSCIAQAKVSVDRIESYLQEDELQDDAVIFVPKETSEVEIEIENGKFSWDVKSHCPTLDGIQIKVKRGMKVAICGTVGSGKSSLLSCILGEIPKILGKVKVSGTKAYVPQSPWILTGNVRDNILFGNPYDQVKYERTIRACALSKDLELFQAGDLTEIGERGINMSGGQKQRIQLARAAYQDADIYILDDPFSAVDAHTGSQLFEECLMGILKEKTILYVTNQVEFLPAADLILMMQEGKIIQAGRFEELLAQNIGFELLVGAHSEALESILNVKNSSRTLEKVHASVENDIHATTKKQLQNGKKENLPQEITEKGGRLTQKEEREKGSIGKEVYWSYLTMVWGGALVPLIVLAQFSFDALQIGSNYWIAWASPVTTNSKPVVKMNVMFLVYLLIAVVSAICILSRQLLVAIAGILTSQKLFMTMLHSVFRAPMSFFDSTPTGRILNRVSTDQSVLDLELAKKVGFCAFSIIQLLGTVAVMSQVAWQVFAIFIPVTGICIWYQKYYTPTARELARLSGIQQAPILHHFAESLAGVATIRAYNQENRFMEMNLKLIDNESRPWFHNVAAMEWLSFRLNILSNLVFAFSLVILVSLPEGLLNPSIAGVAVTYGLNLNILQANVIWNLCNAENKMISVERILQYSKLTSEAPLVIEDCRPPSNWPEFGKICFKNLEVRYAEHLPSILKNINCTIPGRKKVGVVGRTGSGKSTLIQALFRTVEPRDGCILIDGINICNIGLHDLRSRLSIIPQDPTMFEGTVRQNLDPLEQFSDKEIWEALHKCQLGDLIRAKEEKLDSPGLTVVDNGENWSVGQRQLFCLGRALLKKSSILILDEATASIDSATDGIIQKIISQEFENRTVVTIAHRIHTIIDSDLVLVLSEGRVAEYDTPAKLLEHEDSFFSKLIKEYSMRSKGSSTA